jgi:ATP-dependent DNA ligase
MLCTSKRQLTAVAECILSEGGEGLILRKVKSFYIPGRSDLLLKFKVSILVRLCKNKIKIITFIVGI